MIQPINWRMVSHPMNWITIFLMLIIAGAIGHYLLSYLGIEPKLKGQSSFDAAPAGQSPGEAASGAITPQGYNDPYSWATTVQ